MSEKQVLLVTGAGRGMGTDIAKAALAAGHTVVATGRSIERVADAVGEHDDLLVVPLDVTDTSSVQAAVDVIVSRLGRIDVVVNNAGNFKAGFFEEITPLTSTPGASAVTSSKSASSPAATMPAVTATTGSWRSDPTEPRPASAELFDPQGPDRMIRPLRPVPTGDSDDVRAADGFRGCDGRVLRLTVTDHSSNEVSTFETAGTLLSIKDR